LDVDASAAYADLMASAKASNGNAGASQARAIHLKNGFSNLFAMQII
jgi:hypothetical protein